MRPKIILFLSLILMVTSYLSMQFIPIGRAESPADPFGAYFRRSGDSLLGGVQMVDAGVQWANLHVHWQDVEKTPGKYDWSSWDGVLADATEKGLQVILTVGGNPQWAADTACGPIREEHQASHAAFLRAAVERYSVAPYFVLHWALYNEPDNGDPVNFPWLGGCWGGTHPNHLPNAGGAAYAHMLSYAYPAIKAGNQDAQVLLGGLAYEYWYLSPYWGPFDPNFLDDLLAAGGANYFDIINFHYYPAWAFVWSTGDRYTSNIYGKAKYIRDQVRYEGGVWKPILCTEVGYPTEGPPGDSLPYSDELSARYVIKVYVRAMSAQIHPVIWLQAVDEAWLPHKYGLLNEDLSPKLPYNAYSTLTRELSGAQFERARQDFDPTLEGYEFTRDGRQLLLVWTTGEFSGTMLRQVSGQGGVLRVVDKYGKESLLVDGGTGDLDGVKNGWVKFPIDASPRFAEDYTGVTPTPTPTPTSTPKRPIEHYLPLLFRLSVTT